MTTPDPDRAEDGASDSAVTDPEHDRVVVVNHRVRVLGAVREPGPA